MRYEETGTLARTYMVEAVRAIVTIGCTGLIAFAMVIFVGK